MKEAAEAILDHLLLGAADLDRAIDWVEKRTGIRAAPGGSHPGRGTRNALLSLGERQYLEIIAPDPAQQGQDTWLPHLHSLTEPQIVWWAAAATSAADLSRTIREHGLEVLGPKAGARARPDGGMVKWTALAVSAALAGARVDPVPFFIEWTPETVHPSRDSPRAGRLVSVEFEHPDPERLRTTLEKMGIDAVVKPSSVVRIVAVLDTARGNIVLA